jgi:hypothetical protein
MTVSFGDEAGLAAAAPGTGPVPPHGPGGWPLDHRVGGTGRLVFMPFHAAISARFRILGATCAGFGRVLGTSGTEKQESRREIAFGAGRRGRVGGRGEDVGAKTSGPTRGNAAPKAEPPTPAPRPSGLGVLRPRSAGPSPGAAAETGDQSGAPGCATDPQPGGNGGDSRPRIWDGGRAPDARPRRPGCRGGS